MDKRLAAAGSVGLGAGLMYLLDPTGGRRRRALLRDQLYHSARKTGGVLQVAGRDALHRSRGMVAGARHAIRRERVSDDVLMARVRSRIGRSVSHPHAIEVRAEEGNVILRGDVLRQELEHLLHTIRGVSGVQKVTNQLDVRDSRSNVPSLQGKGRYEIRGRRRILSPASRAFIILGVGLGLGAAGLMVYRLAE